MPLGAFRNRPSMQIGAKNIPTAPGQGGLPAVGGVGAGIPMPGMGNPAMPTIQSAAGVSPDAIERRLSSFPSAQMGGMPVPPSNAGPQVFPSKASGPTRQDVNAPAQLIKQLLSPRNPRRKLSNEPGGNRNPRSAAIRG